MKFFLISTILVLSLTVSVWADQVESLVKVVKETEQTEAKLPAIQSLGEIGDDRAVGVLSEQARLADPQIRFAAIKSLGSIGTASARQVLSELEQTGDSEQQHGALIALAMAKDPQAKNLAEEGLQSPGWTTRWYSVLALDMLSDPTTAPLLESALTDPYQLPDGGRYPIREAAQAALDKMKSSIHWFYDLPGSLTKASVENKPVLLYFYINGGEWCEQFEQETFSKIPIQKLAEQFIAVRVNAYSQAELSGQYGITGTPSLLILNAQGLELSRLPGYVSADRVQSYLEEALAAVSEKGGKAEQWIHAESLIDKGDYREAIPALEAFLSEGLPGSFAGKEEWARFMLALSYGKIENYARSKELFEQYVKQFPSSNLMDKALYCLALAKLRLAERDSARQTLTDLLARFPDSPVVKQAQDLLNQLLEIS